ncbi:MAG: WYL domain-containing protein [Bdellovibrio sp.]|nr:WYL domain-containing protein [Bdellovibrio sp.]
MTYNSFVFRDRAFQLACAIERLEHEIPLNDFLKKNAALIEDFQQSFDFFQSFGIEIKTAWVNSDLILYPLQQSLPTKLTLSLCEWAAISAHFPLMLKFRGKYFNKLAEEVLGKIEQGSSIDCFGQNHLAQNKSKFMASAAAAYREKVFQLEEYIFCKTPLKLEMRQDIIKSFPFRVIFLEGRLVLVHENLELKNLSTLDIEKIQNINELKTLKVQPKHTLLDANDFIAKMRAIGEKEERLVLKILSQAHVDLSPNYYFMGNPFLTTNYKGDLIWAATVEDSQELFEWLYSIKPYIEILDPTNLIKKYNEFEKNYKMLAIKKTG